jgi:hypothetical protein
MKKQLLATVAALSLIAGNSFAATVVTTAGGQAVGTTHNATVGIDSAQGTAEADAAAKAEAKMAKKKAATAKKTVKKSTKAKVKAEANTSAQ